MQQAAHSRLADDRVHDADPVQPMDQTPVHPAILSLKAAPSQSWVLESVLLLLLPSEHPLLAVPVPIEQPEQQHPPLVLGSRAVDRDRHFSAREDLSIYPNS